MSVCYSSILHTLMYTLDKQYFSEMEMLVGVGCLFIS